MPLFLTLKQLLKSAFQLALESKCVTLLDLKVDQTSYEFAFFLWKNFQTIPYQRLRSFLFSIRFFLLLVKAAGHTEVLNTSSVVHKSFRHGTHKHLRASTLKVVRDKGT